MPRLCNDTARLSSHVSRSDNPCCGPLLKMRWQARRGAQSHPFSTLPPRRSDAPDHLVAATHAHVRPRVGALACSREVLQRLRVQPTPQRSRPSSDHVDESVNLSAGHRSSVSWRTSYAMATRPDSMTSSRATVGARGSAQRKRVDLGGHVCGALTNCHRGGVADRAAPPFAPLTPPWVASKRSFSSGGRTLIFGATRRSRITTSGGMD